METTPVAPYIAPELEENVNMKGIAPSESEEIKLSYSPYFLKIAEIKESAKKINFENPTELDQEIARKLRIATVKIRTGCEEVKNERKRPHSLKANIEQAAYNLIAAGCKLEEDIFLKVEKSTEIKMKAQKDALRVERLAALEPFGFDPGQVKVEDLPEQSFEILLSGLKQKAKEAEEAAARAEAERIETEARNKRKADRITQLMNLGAKRNELGEISLEAKNKNSENKIAVLSAGEVEYMDAEKYLIFVSQFQKISSDNSDYEKNIEAENERMKKEAEEKEMNQKRYNARVAALTGIGAETTLRGFSMVDVTNDEHIFVSFAEVMDYDSEAFESIENYFKSAKHNNDHQLAEARKEAAKIEDQKRRAAEAQELRHRDRLMRLHGIGVTIFQGGAHIASLNSKASAHLTSDQISHLSDNDFKDEIIKFQAIASQNAEHVEAQRIVALEKAAKEKAEKEAEQKGMADLEDQRRAALAPDKEKLLAFAETLKCLPRPELKAKEAANIMNSIEELIGKTIKYLTDKATQL